MDPRSEGPKGGGQKGGGSKSGSQKFHAFFHSPDCCQICSQIGGLVHCASARANYLLRTVCPEQSPRALDVLHLLDALQKSSAIAQNSRSLGGQEVFQEL